MMNMDGYASLSIEILTQRSGDEKRWTFREDKYSSLVLGLLSETGSFFTYKQQINTDGN